MKLHFDKPPSLIRILAARLHLRVALWRLRLRDLAGPKG